MDCTLRQCATMQDRTKQYNTIQYNNTHSTKYHTTLNTTVHTQNYRPPGDNPTAVNKYYYKFRAHIADALPPSQLHFQNTTIL